jgi:hypothetical protein
MLAVVACGISVEIDTLRTRRSPMTTRATGPASGTQVLSDKEPFSERALARERG